MKLTPYISLEPFKIGKGGELRKGAAIKVRIQGLPVTVMQALPAPVVMKAGGGFGSMRVNPASARSVVSSADVLTNLRRQNSRILRFTGMRGMPAVLAFGPTAVADFPEHSNWSASGVSVNWKGFAVSSAASQSGNAVGVLSGAVASALVVGIGGVALVATLPVLAVGLVAGVTAQALWSYSGWDKDAAGWVKTLLD